MKKLVHQNYKKILTEAQSELSPLERSAAKFFHIKIMWRLAESCDIVLLRFTPSLLGYSIGLGCGLLFIIVAFIFNYTILSLHALLLFFAIGYILGLIIDYLRLLTRRMS